MIKRIIDISDAAYLHLDKKQLIIDKEGKSVGSAAIEDLGILILQHPAIVITQATIIACQQNNVVVVFCDQRHLPLSILLPVSAGHTLHSKIVQQQIDVTAPKKKRLWQQIVKHKIANQAETLEKAGKETQRLKRIIEDVKSGDPDNYEAQAAQYYWQALMGKHFRRDSNAPDINMLFNYGYAIVRAMTARAIVVAGLHPALGLHHHNQYDGLCLADDLMEPFRPWVDWLVYKISHNEGPAVIDKASKQELLGLLSENVIWGKQTMPLMVASHYLASDLKRAYGKSQTKLHYPLLSSAKQ